jgi:ubiquinone/menaquinone biosynthesis C-methylase UbiE
MFRKQSWLAIVLAAAILLTMFSAANAQLATRPAEEWSKTLDQASRVEGLKIDEVIAKLGLRPDHVIADLGAGTGVFAVPMAKAVPKGIVYAVEIDKGFFPIIEQKAKENKVSNVRTVAGEFTDPKLSSQNIDIAFMHDVLHHVEDRAAYLKSTARYIKPDGRFVIIDYKAAQSPHRDQPDLIVSEELVTAWMKAAGFSKVERVDLFPEKYFLIFSR